MILGQLSTLKVSLSLFLLKVQGELGRLLIQRRFPISEGCTVADSRVYQDPAVVSFSQTAEDFVVVTNV